MNKSSKSISANISTRFQLPLKTNTTFNRTQIFIPYLDNNNVAQIQVDTWTSLSNSVNYNFEKIRVGIGGGFDFTTNGNKDQSINLYGIKLNADWNIIDNLILNSSFAMRLNNTKTSEYDEDGNSDKIIEDWRTSSSGFNLSLGYRF